MYVCMYVLSQVSYHLQQLEKLLMPTQTTKMCLWTMQQDGAFFQATNSPLYSLLCKELEITEAQGKELQDQR